MLRRALEVRRCATPLLSSSLLGLATIGLLAGCPDRTISEVNPQQGRVEYKDIPVTVNRDIDILFVIDDSPSMLDKQTNLKSELPELHQRAQHDRGRSAERPPRRRHARTSVRRAPPTRPPGPGIGSRSGHVLGQRQERQPADVRLALVHRQLHQRHQEHRRHAQDELHRHARRRRSPRSRALGAGGCGFEQHIEAAKRALNNNPANAGFLRPNAYLAIIFIAGRGRLLDGALDAARHRHERPSARCSRSAATASATSATSGGADPNAMNQVGPKGGSLERELAVPDEDRGLRRRSSRASRADPTTSSSPAIAGADRRRTRSSCARRPVGGTAIPARRALVHVHRGANGPRSPTRRSACKQLLDQLPEPHHVLDDLPAGPLRCAARRSPSCSVPSSARPCIDGNARRRRPEHARPRSTTARSRT